MCEVLSLNLLGPLDSLLRANDIPAVGLAYRGKGGWASFPLMVAAIKRSKADALIMTGHHFLTMLALGRRFRGRRMLAVHYHHAGVKPDWQWRLIYWVALRVFDVITFPSDYVRHEAEALQPRVSTKGRTLRNPLALPPLVTEASRMLSRRKLGVSETAKVIGNAGWLIRRKRFDIFLEIASRIKELIPNAMFVIAGDGDERDQLVEQSNRLKVSDRLLWLGWQPDLTDFYQSLDALVFSTDWDAFPTTPLEAMSFGVPVVASSLNGGLREVFLDNGPGYFFDHHDIDAMTAAVIDVIQSKRSQFIHSARARVRTLCDPIACGNAVEAFILKD